MPSFQRAVWATLGRHGVLSAALEPLVAAGGPSRWTVQYMDDEFDEYIVRAAASLSPGSSHTMPLYEHRMPLRTRRRLGRRMERTMEWPHPAAGPAHTHQTRWACECIPEGWRLASHLRAASVSRQLASHGSWRLTAAGGAPAGAARADGAPGVRPGQDQAGPSGLRRRAAAGHGRDAGRAGGEPAGHPADAQAEVEVGGREGGAAAVQGAARRQPGLAAQDRQPGRAEGRPQPPATGLQSARARARAAPPLPRSAPCGAPVGAGLTSELLDPRPISDASTSDAHRTCRPIAIQRVPMVWRRIAGGPWDGLHGGAAAHATRRPEGFRVEG